MQYNSLENNYNLIKLFYRQLKKELISAEEYSEKKKLLFEDKSWKTEYNKLKGKKAKNYLDRAYVALFALYYINGAISQEEFELYAEKLCGGN